MKTRIALSVAVWLSIAACAGCGGGSDGSGTAGAGAGTAGTTGAAGSAAGGRGGAGGTNGGTSGTVGMAGTSGGAGTNGGTAGSIGGAGRGGGAGTMAGGGAGGTGGGGTGGTVGAAGRGGTTGSAGTGGAAGRGGAAGTGAAGTGAGGRGGNGGLTGTAGSGGGNAGRGGTTGTGGGAGGTGGRITNPRIMPLGDSTTASICYRALLWQMLTGSGRTQFNFIGTRMGDPGCGVSGYDRDNEGHGGYIVTDVLKPANTGVRPGGADSTDPFVSDSRDLATWFDGKPADIVLMHFGTNDVWNNIAPATILQAYTTILGRLRGANPNVRVLVAKITSLAPSGCTDCPTRVTNLNNMIPGWATANGTTASPITVVDQNTGFNPATDTGDGVHANASGSMKIATNWFNALTPLF